MSTENWQLKYDVIIDQAKSYGEEALLTLGNGYVGWRGAPVWATYDENHYPALYVAGVFNQTKTPVAGRDVVNEDLVNLPNPQLIKINVNGELLTQENLSERESTLHFDNGALTEIHQFKVSDGTVTVATTKVVDPVAWRQIALQVQISTDFKAKVQLESLVDTSVINQNVKRYRDFESREFDVDGVDIEAQHVFVKTRQSGINIGLGINTQVLQQSQLLPKTVDIVDENLVESFTTELLPGVPATLVKNISVITSQDYSEELAPALTELMAETSFEQVRLDSADYWEQVWREADIELVAEDTTMQQLLRMNVFHLRQAAQSNANPSLDVSVGSRGLTGEGYRGHIFWDELFLIPYYAANDPQTARALIQYRIQRLAAAQANAHKEQEVGAMFPWQAGLYGDEQAQVIHLNTVDNTWIPDNSRLQRHVSLAIAYDLWVYTKVTGDESLLNNSGLTMLLEIAKFWLNKVELASDDIYDLSGVMGPDEFHEAYPDSNEGGLKNNAYTNVMLAWLLEWILELGDELSAFEAIAFSDDFDESMMEKVSDVAHGLRLERNDEGVFAQYEGYFNLKELDFEAYTEKYGDIHRVDRLLKAEGKSPDDYQVAKQADLLMLMYNFDSKHVEKLLNQLGYPVAADWLLANTEYYLARTVHGSTTSRPVFAGIDVELGRLDEAEALLSSAIRSDVDDIQGGTTAEGIHTGVMGETLAVVQNKFGGVKLTGDMLEIDPHLPISWESLHFKQRYQNTLIDIIETHAFISITSDHEMQVEVAGDVYTLMADQPLVVSLEA